MYATVPHKELVLLMVATFQLCLPSNILQIPSTRRDGIPLQGTVDDHGRFIDVYVPHNLGICAISRLCKPRVRNLKIAHVPVHPTVSNLLCSLQEDILDKWRLPP